MTEKKGLKDAYSLKTPEDSINLYKTWASTYMMILPSKMTTALQ